MANLFLMFLDLVHYLLTAKWWHDAMAFTCRKIKHSVLAYAHPFPSIIEVHVGREHSIPAKIMSEMLDCIDYCNDVYISNSCQENDVFTEVNDDIRVPGLLAGIRYLGRISRMYPTTPETALQIDASLDRVSHLIDVMHKWEENNFSKDEKELIQGIVAKHMQNLEEQFHSKLIWIAGFDQKTVLDVCWTAIFCWFSENNIVSEIGEEYPNLACWWQHVRPEYVVLDEISDDEKTDEKTDEKMD